MEEYGVSLITMEKLTPADGVILAVSHESYVEAGWQGVTALLKDKDAGFVFDLKAVLSRESKPEGLTLWRL